MEAWAPKCEIISVIHIIDKSLTYMTILYKSWKAGILLKNEKGLEDLAIEEMKRYSTTLIVTCMHTQK